jgi:hypothetical protein
LPPCVAFNVIENSIHPSYLVCIPNYGVAVCNIGGVATDKGGGDPIGPFYIPCNKEKMVCTDSIMAHILNSTRWHLGSFSAGIALVPFIGQIFIRVGNGRAAVNEEKGLSLFTSNKRNALAAAGHVRSGLYSPILQVTVNMPTS